MSMSRPAIPEHIKREVRRRCGFGCVICGHPLYDFEHMEEWSVVQRHVAEEITLLCDSHHREKTAGLMAKVEVYEANKNPFNLRQKHSSDYILRLFGPKARFLIGRNAFQISDTRRNCIMIPILLHGRPIIMFEIIDNECFLNFTLFDKNGIPILVIEKNVLVYKIGIWDIFFIKNRLIVKQEKRNILLEIQFNPPTEVHIKKAKIYCKEGILLITENEVTYNDNPLQVYGFTLSAPIAISIGNNYRGPAIFHIPTPTL